MLCCIPIPTTDSNTGMGMICVTLNTLSAVEECREPSGNCQGSSHYLECGHPVNGASAKCYTQLHPTVASLSHSSLVGDIICCSQETTMKCL